MQVDDRMKFILSAAAGALGVLVTFVFIPEITSLDLKEGDTRWEMIKKGVVLSRGCRAQCPPDKHDGSSWQPFQVPML